MSLCDTYGQSWNSNNNMKPGDVFHPDFEQGLPTYFDLTVRNSIQPLYIAQAAQHAVGLGRKRRTVDMKDW